MASFSPLEQRVAALEADAAMLKRRFDKPDGTIPWWEQIAGTFENDPSSPVILQTLVRYRDCELKTGPYDRAS